MNDLSIFDSLFNDVMGTDVAPVLYHTSTHFPKVNVAEEEDAYVLEMELPGRNENDVNIELNHENLTISSKAEEKEDEKKNRKYLIRECRTKSFSRTFALPSDVDAENITASFKNGILTVNMKKKAIAAPKKISIKAE